MTILFAIVMLSGAGVAQDSLNIRLASNLVDCWSRGHDLAKDRDVLYIGTLWDGVWIFDVSDPLMPTELGRFLSGRNINSLTVVNETAYVVVDTSGKYIGIFDVSDPSAVQELSRIELLNMQNPMHDGPVVVDGYLYAGVHNLVGDQGIWSLGIWDVHDPAHPELINQYQDQGRISDAAYSNGRIYAMAENRNLVVLDVQDPRNVRLLGCRWGAGNYHFLKIFNSYLYCWRNSEPNKLSVFDVSDPNNIVETWFTEDIRQVDDMTAMEDFLFVARGAADGNGFNQGLAVLDISNPREPEWVRQYQNEGTQDLSSLASGEGFLYSLSFNYSQLKVWNAHEPSDMEVIYASENYGDVKDVDLCGNYAYVTFSGWAGIGLGIYDMINPRAPRFCGWFPLMPDAHSPKTTISGELLFAVGRGAPFDVGGIRIMSLRQPENPELLYMEGGGAYEIALREPYAYVANGAAGLRVLDVSDPTDPQEAAVIPSASAITRVDLAGRRLFMVDFAGEDTAWVVSIADPLQPMKMGSFRAGDDVKYYGFAMTDRALF